MGWEHSKLVAEVYRFHLPVGYSNGDVEYYARALQGVSGSILEPACGTGRVLIPLLEAGHRVEGVDHSEEMLEFCRTECSERGLGEPVLHHADMATFERAETYEAVIMPAGSIRNLDGRQATVTALRSFYRSLTPGGRLVIDVAAPEQIVTAAPSVEIHRRDSYVWTTQTLSLEYDPILNRSTQFVRYEKWHDGEQVAVELHRYLQQYWGIEEFEALLREAGFSNISVAADYEDRAPVRTTRDWTFQAVRS